MNKVKLSSLFFILIFILAVVPMVSFADDDDGRSYSIPKATFDLYVQEDGNLKVKETLHYSFSGTYNGVYRTINIKDGEKIRNLKVFTKGAYSSFEVTSENDNKAKIKVYLYSNAQHTLPITNRDVTVTYEYDFVNVTQIYKDVAALHYKVWGEEWDVGVGELTTNIHLPSQKGVKYWLNPPYYVQNDKWDGSILKITTDSISPGNFFEVRLAIPKEQFKNPVYAQQIDEMGLPKMEKIQEEYLNGVNLFSTLYYVLSVLMILSIAIPFLIYFKHGREPKTTFQGIYQRELPTNDLPAVVNAISGKVSQVGKPTMDGFQATIMDLINRRYLEVSVDDLGKKKQVILKINEDKVKNSNELQAFERDVIKFLRTMAVDDLINMNQMKKDLKKKKNATKFKDIYDQWEEDLGTVFLKEKTSQFFIDKGANLMRYFGIGALIVAGIAFYFNIMSPPVNPLPASTYVIIASVILGIAGLIAIFLPQKVGGRWTQEGVDFDAQWQAFKKYIQDFSQLKEYPPESVKVWNHYLVYATALGVADKVKKVMELSLPSDQLESSNLYMFHYYGGYAILSSGLSTGMSTATSDSGGSGGVGGVGGGSGGGGGGAF
ncbi:MAG: DUF2207 domain-containing protein [Methanobacterium sp.]|jgi:uncharacterized membrane protein